MPTLEAESPSPPVRSISIGLTCWVWEWSRPRALVRLAQQTGVKLELRERRHGLHRDIEGLVSGTNVDRFLGEFVRRG